jgi:hypothetical protein
LSSVEDLRESPLRHQTRKVSCSPDGRFFAVGSTEVRREPLILYSLSSPIQLFSFDASCIKSEPLLFHYGYATLSMTLRAELRWSILIWMRRFNLVNMHLSATGKMIKLSQLIPLLSIPSTVGLEISYSCNDN